MIFASVHFGWIISNIILAVLLVLIILARYFFQQKIQQATKEGKKLTSFVLPAVVLAVPEGKVSGPLIFVILLILDIFFAFLLVKTFIEYLNTKKVQVKIMANDNKQDVEVIKQQEVVTNSSTTLAVNNPNWDKKIPKKLVRTNFGTAKLVLIRYNKSFRAKISMTEERNRQYYQELKEYILSYKKINSRISWSCDSFNYGRKQFSKITIRGNSLFMFIALDPSEFIDSKYSFKDVSESKKYLNVPMKVKLRSERSIKWAKELVDILANKLEIPKTEIVKENYLEEVRSFKKNLSMLLIKETKGSSEKKVMASIETSKIFSNEINKNNLRQQIKKEVDVCDVRNIVLDVDITREIKKNLPNGSGKKTIVNLDMLCDNFEDGETIDLNSLINRRLIPKNSKYVKCLARGILNKRFVFRLQEYSDDAIKMILLTGGKIE